MNNPVDSPWAVEEADFPSAGTPAEKLHFFLRYAVLAPSRYNTQPWRFTVHRDTAELSTDPARALPVLDPLERELIISCGAALVFLRLTIAHFGYTAHVTTFPDPARPEVLARVQLGHRGAAVEAADELLFHAILQRRTNRQAFSAWPVPEPLLAALEAAAATHGAWLQVIRSPRQYQEVAELIAEGERLAEADPAVRRERTAWLRPSLATAADGIPDGGPGLDTALPDPALPLGGVFVPGADPALPASPSHRPTLAVLGTPADLPPYWLIAGESLGRVLLRASADGVAAWFLNQPIETGVLRPQLMARLGHRGFPQVLLRLGYAPAAPPTPRRPVEDVLR
jgi:nitroreductase